MWRIGGVLVCFLVSRAFAFAGTIDVSSQPLVEVRHGARLNATFSIANFARLNPGSPLPAEFRIEVLGPTHDSEFGDYVFEAWLSSLDGAFTKPAGKLGGEAGTIGLFGEARDAIVFAGTAFLNPSESAALFGPDSRALLVLRNTGVAVTLGMGEPYAMRHAVRVSGLRGAGPYETGGYVTQVTYENPEPATLVLIGSGLAGIGLLRRRQRAESRAKTPRR